MAYSMQTWVDEQLNGTPKYEIIQDGTTIAPAATIELITPLIRQGSRFIASRMNYMERGIRDAYDEAEFASEQALEANVRSAANATAIQNLDTYAHNVGAELQAGEWLGLSTAGSAWSTWGQLRYRKYGQFVQIDLQEVSRPDAPTKYIDGALVGNISTVELRPKVVTYLPAMPMFNGEAGYYQARSDGTNAFVQINSSGEVRYWEGNTTTPTGSGGGRFYTYRWSCTGVYPRN